MWSNEEMKEKKTLMPRKERKKRIKLKKRKRSAEEE